MALNEGTYKWEIDRPDFVNKIKNTRHSDRYESDIFSLVELTWQIIICPNGANKRHLGSFDVFLKLITLPLLWDSIVINKSIGSPQTKAHFTSIDIYDKSGKSFGWPKNTLTLKEIKLSKCKSIIFVIKLKILHITLKEKNNGSNALYKYKFNWRKHQQIVWNLRETNTLNKAKRSHNGKRFESKVFNNLWCIGLYPNGHTRRHTGQCFINLQLCAYPMHVSYIRIQWNVCIKQLKFKRTNISKRKTESCGPGIVVAAFDQFKKCKNIEIIVNVIIINQYDANNKEIKIKSISKWDNIQKEALQHSQNNQNSGNSDKIENINLQNINEEEEKNINEEPESTVLEAETGTEPEEGCCVKRQLDIKQINYKLLAFEEKINSLIALSTNMEHILKLNKEKDDKTILLNNVEHKNNTKSIKMHNEAIEQLKAEITKLNNKSLWNYKEIHKTTKLLLLFQQQLNVRVDEHNAKIKSLSHSAAKTMVFLEDVKTDEKGDRDIDSELSDSDIINRWNETYNKYKMRSQHITEASDLEKMCAFFEFEVNLPQYCDIIIDAGFESVDALMDLTNEDLRELNVKIAHRKIILKGLQQKKVEKFKTPIVDEANKLLKSYESYESNKSVKSNESNESDESIESIESTESESTEPTEFNKLNEIILSSLSTRTIQPSSADSLIRNI